MEINGELVPKIVMPFLVMIIASLLTKPNRREALDRFYVKMKTTTEIDPEKDREELELYYAEPDRYDHKKLFPGTALEFQRPGRADIAGFALSCLGVVGIIFLALWVAGLGAGGARHRAFSSSRGDGRGPYLTAPATQNGLTYIGLSVQLTS